MQVATISHPVLNSYDIWELKRENRIIKSDLTLTSILNTVLPSGENNPKYLDICLQSLYAASPQDSYIYKSESGQWVQISRKDTDCEDIDDEDFDDENFYGE